MSPDCLTFKTVAPLRRTGTNPRCSSPQDPRKKRAKAKPVARAKKFRRKRMTMKVYFHLRPLVSHESDPMRGLLKAVPGPIER